MTDSEYWNKGNLDNVDPSWHAAAEDILRNAPAKTFGVSYNRNHDREFVALNVARSASHLRRYEGAPIELIGFSPIWQLDGNQGVLALELRRLLVGSETYTLFVAFGRPGGARQTFVPKQDYRVDAKRIFNETLEVRTWDEAWAFACKLAETMRARSMTLRFGI